MNTTARLKKIEKVLNKKFDPERLYYPIWPKNNGIPADKNGIPPPLMGGLSIVNKE